ncbi:MAG: TetR/AcrR family transcriptional regulator [Usitatibacter sp.]
MKQRAIGTEDKEIRRQAILDAVEKLFVKHPQRMASVSEVAATAGLAKGTVYLYFPSKEEMLLALHERHVAHFFGRLLQKLAEPGPLDFNDIFPVTRDHLIRLPGYLELTSRCFGLMDREIPADTAIAFKARIAQTLQGAGVHLERHFGMARGGGVNLLLHSYGLIMGLWQLLHPNKRFGKAMRRPELRILDRNYEKEIELALRSLWTGSMAPAEKKRKMR